MDIRKFFINKVSATESSRTVQSQQQEEELHTADVPLDAEEGSGSCLESLEELPERLGDSSENLSLVCDATDLGDVEKGPVQPKLAKYPYDDFGTQKRSFQFNWFEKYSWLEYSIRKNASFCFTCRNFGPKQGCSHLESVLCKTGFKNWKRALDSFTEHGKSAAHKSSMLAWSAYKDSILHGNVLEKIQTGSEVQIQERRDYLKRLVAITMFLSKQGISFRGHDESENSQNKGNFKECLKLVSKFDPFLKHYIPPANATYTSPVSQNAIIQCCSEEVISMIVSELKASGVYSVMADEARDHQKEQLAICIRYVLPSNGEIKEHFIAFKELKDFCADSITESLQECLKDYGLDSLLCVAQTYDGAAVMSGVSGGVQAKFQKYHPEAIYVHCYAHELNLVLCHTCKAVKEAKDYFNTMENLYTFFSTSLIHHQKFKDMQSTLALQPGELVQLSDTRWSCQIRAVNALITNFVSVYKCLSEINSSTASGLLSKLRKISVIFCLFMFQTLLSTTEGFHKMLQKENLDLAKAIDLKEAVCSTLKSMRTVEKASEILLKAENLLSSVNTKSQEGIVPRKKQKYLENYVTEPSFAREDISTKHDFRIKIFFPCLDRMLSELDLRFSSIQKELMRGIQACSPLSQNFLSEDIAEIAKHYKIELQSEELLVAKNYFARKQLHGEQMSMDQVYQLLDPLMFPTVKKIIQIALSIPVSSCSCERSFSVLRRLHNWLRCTMGQSRLNNLAVLSIEKQVLESVSEEDVIARFGRKQTRRHALALTNVYKS